MGMVSPSSTLIRRAVIDVGTNSVKVLIADVNGRVVKPVFEDSEQTRLGAGFYETHRLQPRAITHTAEAVATFVRAARGLDAVSARVIATSAARDALNAAELTTAIEQASGMKVEIISGDQEADWVFQGVTTDPELAGQPLLLLDVGGGSTEFILGQGEQKHFSQSFRLGTVRLLEKLQPGDPPAASQLAGGRQWVRTFLEKEVRPKLEAALRREAEPNSGQGAPQLIGTGGTATILARMEARLDDFDRERIEGTRLKFDRVRAYVERLWSLPLAERKRITGLPKKRADVILTGVVIYEAVMETFGFDELRVSTRGLRFAAVMDAKT
jgi:exopolyphosphatase/guanosine-5'-triphosphate,3'-diphosphate pyrophosphatase